MQKIELLNRRNDSQANSPPPESEKGGAQEGGQERRLQWEGNSKLVPGNTEVTFGAGRSESTLTFIADVTQHRLLPHKLGLGWSRIVGFFFHIILYFVALNRFLLR